MMWRGWWGGCGGGGGVWGGWGGVFFFNDTATTEIYTLSLHDALPISMRLRVATRTLKNSSRLLEKMPKKRMRSTKGTFSSAASCSTRSLNWSQLISRLINFSLVGILVEEIGRAHV